MAAELLRRRVSRRSHDPHPQSIAVDESSGYVSRDRNPQVSDLDASLVVHEAVGRFHVAMQDAGVRRRIEPGDDVENGHRRLRSRASDSWRLRQPASVAHISSIAMTSSP